MLPPMQDSNSRSILVLSRFSFIKQSKWYMYYNSLFGLEL